ncbi:MAG: J domain-containing protein [Nitrospina sp.]|nr:J domain-containing protein [Nitrospina sp.]
MSWLWGAGLGLLRGGPLGALVGGAVGHFITKKVRKKVLKRLPGIRDEDLFITSTVVILTRLATLGGDITARQVEIVYRFFVRNLGYDTKDLASINYLIRETLRVTPDIKPVAEKFLEASPDTYRSLLLALGYQLILIENRLTEEAQKAVNDLAKFLKLSFAEHQEIRDRFSLDRLRTPFMVLGVNEDASFEDVRKAYRQRMAEHHPDRVAHLGEEQTEASHLKFLEVQAAYREIENLRNH